MIPILQKMNLDFYDSIYTHTIEWAIIGKDEAKANTQNKKYKHNVGEMLDEFTTLSENNFFC